MLVDFLKEMIKEKTYYKRIDNFIEIWQEKEKNKKAIEYIKENSCELETIFGKNDWHITIPQKLLDILEGSDK